MKLEINPQRLLAELRELATFGAYRTGVHRPTFSPQDMAARRWVIDRMTAAGLEPRMDGIGNILGMAPGERRRLLVGSHSDSQNHAGWLDGAMGVVYALEIARAVAESGRTDVAVEPVDWADEEAHFASFLGSRSAIGEVSEEEIDAARCATTGTPLRLALADAGLAGRERLRIEPARYLGYLEAHIEQGDYLDAHGLALGVVTTIVGIWQYRLTVRGQRNHGGTTRMAVRKDAGAALVMLINRIEERFRALAGDRTVWTVGNIRLEPGQVSIIPDLAEMMLQVRDSDPDVLWRMDAALRALVEETNAAGPCSAALELVSSSAPHAMSTALKEELDSAAEEVAPGRAIRMPSGAGHDAQILAQVMPSGMLFVPSIGGISHHWDENTRDDDLVLGCRALAGACARLLTKAA
ncbi:Zn-dependent hydrolase [Mesorhizobium sp.]|uniref:Zn-dependent hydrolase n=1 Tax=Mesorhizobium sp. TaxID=1871066 RepID=UPI000FE8F76A|nr:Zn-dependent hydrolase [Mesorhizobium sp.]RWI88897.1 MAG: Zn-dependent hydrolase [Mesorhizobium sp.]